MDTESTGLNESAPESHPKFPFPDRVELSLVCLAAFALSKSMVWKHTYITGGVTVDAVDRVPPQNAFRFPALEV